MARVRRSVSDCYRAVTDVVESVMAKRRVLRASIFATFSVVSTDLATICVVIRARRVLKSAAGAVSILVTVHFLAVLRVPDLYVIYGAQSFLSVVINVRASVEKSVPLQSFVMSVEMTLLNNGWLM